MNLPLSRDELDRIDASSPFYIDVGDGHKLILQAKVAIDLMEEVKQLKEALEWLAQNMHTIWKMSDGRYNVFTYSKEIDLGTGDTALEVIRNARKNEQKPLNPPGITTR